MPTDNFLGVAAPSVMAPARSGAAVTTHDTNEITVPRAVYVGGAGNLTVILTDDTTAITFNSVAAGSILDIRPRIIKATGTTATNILALY